MPPVQEDLMPVQLFLSVFSQDSLKSLSSPNTSTKKGRKCVIFPVLTKLNQEPCLYSPLTSTMAYKLFLQKGRCFDLLSSKCRKIHYKHIWSSCKFYVLCQHTPTFLKAAKCLISNRVFTPCYRSIYTTRN